MRRLWQDHLTTGYTQADFNKIVSDMAGPEVVQWLDKNIYSTEELDYSPLFEAYGLQFKAPKAAAPTDVPETYLGADASLTEGRLTIKRVLRDSPAHTAGLNVDDEWIAIDNYRVGNDWSDRITHYRPGDEINTLISRRGKLITIPVRLGTKPAANWKLEIAKEPSAEQKVRFRQWLKLPEATPAETPVEKK